MKLTNGHNIENVTDAVLCIVVPFLLFWGGIVASSFLPFAIFMPLGLIPFYVYTYFSANLSVRPVYREMMIECHFVGIASLVAFVATFLIGVLPDVVFVKNMNGSALLNLPFLILVTLFGAFSVGCNMRWGCWDEGWPES